MKVPLLDLKAHHERVVRTIRVYPIGAMHLGLSRSSSKFKP